MILFHEKYGQLGNELSYSIKNGSKTLESKEPVRNRTSKSQPILVWLIEWLRYAFLPQGYPASVSSDYLSYQLWDTLQAFCSYLSGTLTTKAVMQGVGVGDAAATPLAATITWIMRDGTGMIGRIFFASWKGPSLDANCKQWRLAADVLNDMAMSIELCSPMLPEYIFPWALCAATSMKSIVGVAGGATRAALTQHQACRGNMADVAAKDGSQETLVNLVASMVGIVLLPLLTSDVYAWLLFVILTFIHLFANYRAVRCLNIPILNEQRYNLLLQTYLKSLSKSKAIDPLTVNDSESVFLGTGLKAKKLCGFNIKLGASLSSIPDATPELLETACKLSSDYLIVPSSQANTIFVIFHQSKTPEPLKAYFHAVNVGLKINELRKKKSENTSGTVLVQAINSTYDVITDEFSQLSLVLVKKGWLMNRHQLLVDEWQANWKVDFKKDN